MSYNKHLSRAVLCNRVVQSHLCFSTKSDVSSILEDGEVLSKKSQALMSALKPREVVAQLDKFIVGQADAKRAVAIALRNRWRRHQMTDELKNEVIPKNILMIGPTGCGKTEIARRIAKLSQAPFIKVEATKFTEVGFHGKDVDQIIRDLVDISINMTKKRIKDERKAEVTAAVNIKLLDGIVGTSDDVSFINAMRAALLDGEMEDRKIDVEVSAKAGNDKGSVTIDMSNPGFILSEIVKNQKDKGGKKGEKKKMTVAEARPLLEEIESEKLMDEYDIPKEAIASVEVYIYRYLCIYGCIDICRHVCIYLCIFFVRIYTYIYIYDIPKGAIASVEVYMYVYIYL
jgi:ATP-dependent HslUV protease ATP-binding subunit HslU